MTEGTPIPKRRGRPPGSKNKPKPKPATKAPIGVIHPTDPEATQEEVRAIRDSVTDEDIAWMNAPMGPVLTGSPFLPVLLQFRAGLSQALVEQKVDWPQGWPLPNVHDRVVYSVEDKKGGTVVAINYRVDLGEIHILLT